MPTAEPKRPLNLIWLPNTAGLALTTMCRGVVVTVDQRGSNQWPWSVAIGGGVVSEGVSPSMDHAQTAAVEIAFELAGKR